MKKQIRYFKENKNVFLFLFIFSWVFTIKNRAGFANSWGDFVFHPDTPFWVFINACFIFIFSNFIKKKVTQNNTEITLSVWRYLKFFGISFISYIIFVNIIGILISVSFNNFSRNYNNSYQVTYRVFNQIIDFVIFGGISLAYLYAKDNRNYRELLNKYELSSSKSKIQQLKAQLNPHFLFNNLNILDQLIEENSNKASEFLSSFSELYRYALNSSERELITIQEEIFFTKNYFELMKTKYEGCYQLIINNNIKPKNMVPPFCLQVLVENAIIHNLGTKKNPIIITITNENGIKVSNNKIESTRKKKGNGVALKNLNKQFQLLTNNPIKIQETDAIFTVTLPFIKIINND